MTDFEKGTCKWFNVAKGWGFITSEDGTKDVFVHQSVIQMSGFRSLGDNEKVEFKATKTDKGLEATVVRSVGGGDCQGSHRRPGAKQKSKKVRCYNCGEFASHYASQCDKGPLPKRCHNCKSENHLIENCPTLPEEKKRPLREAQNISNGVKAEGSSDKDVANGVKKEATTQQEEKPAQVKEEPNQASAANNNNNNVVKSNNNNLNNNNKKRNNNNNPKVQGAKEKAAK